MKQNKLKSEVYDRPQPEYTGWKALSKIGTVLLGSGLIIVSIIMLISFVLSDKDIWWFAYVVFIASIFLGYYILTHPKE